MKETLLRRPIGFDLLNARGLAELLVTDNPKADAGQSLRVRPREVSRVTFPAGASLALTFSSALGLDLADAEVRCPWGWTWDRGQKRMVSQGCTLEPDETLTFWVEGLRSRFRCEGETTRVQLSYAGLAGDRVRSDGVCLTELDVTHQVGRERLPLRFAIRGPRAILNDGTTVNAFAVRIANVSPETLRLKDGTLTLAFDASPHPDCEWALGTSDQLRALRVSTSRGTTEVSPDTTGPVPVWTVPFPDELAGGKHFDVQIGNLVTRHIAGPTSVSMTLEDIPGYWDAEAILTLEKSPFVVSGPDAAVGRVPSRLTIVRAIYGVFAEGKTVDVTERLRSLVRDGVLDIPSVTNDLLGGDPRWNLQKQLRVEYEIGGIPGTVSVDERASLRLGASQPEAALGVVGTLQADRVRLGGVTIGERELRILKLLADGALTVDLFNAARNEPLYSPVDQFAYDQDRRHVFTWRPGQRVDTGRWRLTEPG